jgi:RHS repeat-associated protein
MGDVVQRSEYDPYGGRTFLTANWGSTTDSYNFTPGFQGLRQDTVTGWLDARNRWMIPSLQTWNRVDPLGYMDGPNTYLPMDGNTVNGRDPWGRSDNGDLGHLREIANERWPGIVISDCELLQAATDYAMTALVGNDEWTAEFDRRWQAVNATSTLANDPYAAFQMVHDALQDILANPEKPPTSETPTPEIPLVFWLAGAQLIFDTAMQQIIQGNLPGIADIAVGIQLDAVPLQEPLTGVELGLGVVFDTNNPLNSGVYLTDGNGYGLFNYGVSAGGTWAPGGINGESVMLDVNLGSFSLEPGVSFGSNGKANPVINGGYGPGIGASVGVTQTCTFTLRDNLTDFLFGLISGFPGPIMP